MEAAYLAALEKTDAENYSLLKAHQDLHLTVANLTLQDLRASEAADGVSLAQLQQQRAQAQFDTYDRWLQAGLSEAEQLIIDSYQTAGTAQDTLAALDALTTTAQATLTAATASIGIGAAAASIPVIGGLAFGRAVETIQANDASTMAQISSVRANYERRAQEWQLQKTLAQQDIAISGQQITLAQDHKQIAQQEYAVAQLQHDHAASTVDFLQKKLTSAELYGWMGGILRGVYSYFLQQATTLARLAQNQLAFERQEPATNYIQADYWQPPSTGMTANTQDGRQSARGGLTGSARLLQDIYQLDQYAFETNKRKLQLAHSFSLARQAPFEFQKFRETGVLPFATPIELFDRAFPGHYLRLIKRVRVSVVALVPPSQGIRATLLTGGISRVVIGGDMFQTTVIRRDPDLIAFTSPMNATGLFDLNPQPDMLLPFEGTGVDTLWELRMPKAANAFDYNTIADVLVTLEYTALNSFDYYEQVIQSLSPKVSADRPFSFRQQFADQWYELHNPDQSATPMTVRFTTTRDDFPPNLDDLKIQQLAIYFPAADGANPINADVRLRLLQGDDKPDLGKAEGVTIDGVVSTRRGWTWSNPNLVPVGEWELTLADVPSSLNKIEDVFQQEQVQDILFLVTYTGRTPEWPA